MSLKHLRWQQAQPPAQLPPELLKAANGSTLLGQLLWQRGIRTAEAAEAFLNLSDYVPTPGMELPDADIALERIITAIDGGEPILIYGDFDVDGQTGTSIFMLALQQLGATVSFYIPDRATEGHGMNTAALCRLVSARKPKLVITTDTGITDFNEVSLLAGLGVDAIITDHHELPENLPQAVANVNPKRYDDPNHPMYGLCGAGVAFKLCEELYRHYNQPQEAIDYLLGIAAIGTVVDMMPLVAENRWLVWRGCQILSQHQHLGVQALIEAAAKDPHDTITSETLGFTLGPRLNALGRLERADDGVALLMATEADEARKIATRLEVLNRKRQEMSEQCLLEAERAMVANGGLQGERAIALASKEWHPGIVGLTATRLKDRYSVPVFLMIEEGDKIRGSARSIPGVDLHAILTRFASEFDHFGGHAGAGGFAFPASQYRSFKDRLLQHCRETIPAELCQPTLEIDAEVEWDQLHTGMVEMVDALAPFGMANPAPVFISQPLTVKAMRRMGEHNQHLKLMVAPNSSSDPIDAVMWSVDADATVPNKGDRVRCVFTPGTNTYQGTTRFQMMLKDVALEGTRSTAASPSPKIEMVSAKESATATTKADSTPKAPLTTGPVWLDHRQRGQLTPLLAQLMQPGQPVVLFHERPEAPDVPFLRPEQVVTRLAPNTIDVLVLWDLPPSPKAMSQLLHAVQPQTVHLVGAALQGEGSSTSLHTPLTDALRTIFRQLRATPSPLSLTQLSAALGLTPALVHAIGLLFHRAGIVEWQVQPAGDDAQVAYAFPAVQNRSTLESLPEYALVAHLWQEMVAFRHFLLTAPLPLVETHVQAAMSVGQFFASTAPVAATQHSNPASRSEPLVGVS